jgi:hypothetical protein
MKKPIILIVDDDELIRSTWIRLVGRNLEAHDLYSSDVRLIAFDSPRKVREWYNIGNSATYMISDYSMGLENGADLQLWIENHCLKHGCIPPRTIICSGQIYFDNGFWQASEPNLRELIASRRSRLNYLQKPHRMTEFFKKLDWLFE